MKRRAWAAAIAAGLALGAAAHAAGEDGGKETEPVRGIHAFTMKSIAGQDVSLADYKGKVLLIVNVASRCGFTGQYEGLQKLYETYGERGLVVLGFPSNDFMGQEPGSNEQIAAFCRTTYGVTFQMFEKISVKSRDPHPLYRFLTSRETNPDFPGEITWNFNKFLVGRDGRIVARFGSRTKPESPEVAAAIEKALAP